MTPSPLDRDRHAPPLLSGGGKLIRSHEPLAPYLVQPGQRVISLVRNGRHVALSYLAHERRYGRFDGDARDFVDRFLVLATVVARGNKDRMRAKEASIAFLATLSTGGSPLVRPDTRQTWADLVPVRSRPWSARRSSRSIGTRWHGCSRVPPQCSGRTWSDAFKLCTSTIF